MKIENSKGEKLDVLVRNLEGKETILFVHGFGTNKHEGFQLFDDIADALSPTFTTVQFDFSAYGESEGLEEESCLSKMADDLSCVLSYAKSFGKPVSIIAHSMGVFVTSLLSPNVKKIIFTSPPGLKADISLANLKKRILSKGGVVNEKGISLYPRSSGGVQKLGSKFWSERLVFSPLEHINRLAFQISITIFQPLQDDVVLNDEDGYKKTIAKVVELSGDHNFTNLEDRQLLIEKIKAFL